MSEENRYNYLSEKHPAGYDHQYDMKSFETMTTFDKGTAREYGFNYGDWNSSEGKVHLREGRDY